MTDEQKKILTYLRKRKTPADLKAVRLQTKIDKQTAVNCLNSLLRKGCIKTTIQINVYAKERVWEWVKDEYEVKKVSRPKKKFKPVLSKPKQKEEGVDISFFNNPFNLRVA
jgi:hypothetical protein